MNLRVIYAGYNFFSSVLGALLERPNIDVPLCLTGAAHEHISNIVELCTEYRVPTYHGRPREDTLELIRHHEPDLILCAAYSYRIPVSRLRIKHNLNLHPSLLPEGRGPNPLPYLVGGHAEHSGLTIHEMTDEFDNGSILAQQAIKVHDDWGFDELAMAMYVNAPAFVIGVLESLEPLFANRRPQVQGTYWPLNSDSDRTIDWEQTVDVITRKSRRFGALGILCRIADNKYEITTPVSAISVRHDHSSGEVILNGKGFWYVAAADGIVRITQPQFK